MSQGYVGNRVWKTVAFEHAGAGVIGASFTAAGD